jgi:hypothetical protein
VGFSILQVRRILFSHFSYGFFALLWTARKVVEEKDSVVHRSLADHPTFEGSVSASLRSRSSEKGGFSEKAVIMCQTRLILAALSPVQGTRSFRDAEKYLIIEIESQDGRFSNEPFVKLVCVECVW